MQKTKNRSSKMRLMALSGLKAGWMDGEGEVISPTALEVAQRLLNLSPDLRSEAGIFPTLEGGVSMEGDSFEVEVHADGAVRLTDFNVDEEGKLFAYDSFITSTRDILQLLGPLAARSVEARKPPVTSEREDRLESILRRILPVSNTATFSEALRKDLAREFANMRGTCGRIAETTYEVTQTLMKYDGPILALARAGDREALLMRLDEEEAGHYFLLVVPTPPVMIQLKNGDICLREACLHQATDTYVCDEIADGSRATFLDGPIRECHLPLPELSVRELIDEYEESMDPS